MDSDSGENIAYQIMDKHDFEHIYNIHWKSVFGIIYHYTKDEEISAELSQELFASLWEQREKIIFHKNVKAYLFKAAKLEAFDYLRTCVRQKQLLESSFQDYCQLQNCTEETVMYNDLREKLDLLIRQLSCRCQGIYRLSQNEGLNNNTIAGMLEISEKTVEYHLYKAKSFLRTHLTSVKS
ncbi:hypothetical protein TH53_01935 [Pedobacter lusitanus]|uniref:Uncharacterized protein n=1 Tax=Pedobacter lusitanus TaxID=1503925 RepID=A0A0D0G1Q2_9SPHI|nr:hypothetical protein TH53_01935 [Pedobacter lusitanus]